MPNPQARDVHIDGLLTRVSLAYRNPDYIARAIAPSCPTNGKLSDNYAVFGKENFNKENTTLRAAGRSAETVDYTLSTDSFSCKEHALKQYVPKVVEDNADSPINPRQRATKNLMDRLLLDEEYALSAVAFSGTYITQNTTLAGVNQWSDYVNSDPVANVETGKAAIHVGTAKKANMAFMGQQVWDKLKNHPDIIERIKYSQRGIVTEELVAEVFGLDKIVVGSALYNTAKEGQTVSLSYVWGKMCLLAYVEPNPALESPTLFYTFLYEDWQTRTWWDDDRKSTAIEVAATYHQKLVDAKAGYLIINAVA